MGALVLTDSLLFVNGANLTGATNKIKVSAEVEALESTTFGSAGWKENAAGLGSHSWEVGGWWDVGDAGKPDDRLWADLGTNAAWLATPAAAEGGAAYFGNVLSASFQFGGEVGALAPYEGKGSGTGRLVRGTLFAGPGTARTVTANGTPVQLGAVAAGKALYASLQVSSVAGTSPTIVVKLQSSTSSGGSYTDRVTFTSANSISSQTGSVAGAVTDTWWRATWTITGTGGPSFLIGVAAGIV